MMNKKIKFLTPTLCGVLLASSLSVVNVQAKQSNGDTNIKSQNNILYRSATDENYWRFSTYCTISHDNVVKIVNYYSNPQGQSINDFLVNNGVVDRSQANLIAHALDEFHGRILQGQDRGNGVKFLKPDDCGNLVRMTVVPNNTYSNNYTQYCKISNMNAWDIFDYINDHPNANSYQLADYIIQLGVTSDRTIANNVASLIMQEGSKNLAMTINAGIYILQSGDGVRIMAPIQV